MKKLSLLLLIICAGMSAHGQGTGYFTNPVIRGDMADPTIIRVDDTYYAAGTSSEWAPHYPIYSSRDLVNWTQEGYVFDRKPEWTSSSFWAPELFVHPNGRIYCYYTARRASDNVSYIGVASADKPTGPYTDHGLLVEFGTEAIDAFVFNDDGQLYISWKAYGLDPRPIELLASRLSDDGLSLVGEPFTLMVDDEDIGMEGQYHFKSGDWYYIIYAPHSCCGPGSDYDVYVARAKNYAGPYERFGGNPILRGGPDSDFQSCGHGTGVTTPDGRTFFMCHAYLNGDGFFAGRQPIVQEFFVTDDGWVQFATGSVAQATQPVPFEGTVQVPLADFTDNFDREKLRAEWSWNYPYSEPRITVGDNMLNLTGTLKEGATGGTALCVRPTSPDYQYSTRVLYATGGLNGLTFYGDDGNMVVWGVDGDKLVLKVAISGEWTVVGIMPAPSAAPHLRIVVTGGCNLAFFAGADGEQWTEFNAEVDGRGNVRWDRIARPGLIVGGEDETARFSYFEMTNL